MISAESIPPELKELPRWVIWRWAERNGKRTKVPFDPASGLPGDATDPALWMSFGPALERLGAYDGLGFAVSDTPFTGVDLDGCLDDRGEPAPWAEAIVRRLDSYTEVTPSGRGLRVWVRGKLPEGRRRKGPIEMYDRGRYFTVTGRRLDGTPAAIADRAAELASLHAEVFPAPEVRRTASRPASSLAPTDEEVLRRAMWARNGDRFSALFGGDLTGYASESEADLALCSHLAFWTGGDLGAIDRLFRRSGLFRDKWDRSDYRERTMAKALEGTSFYDPEAFRAAGRRDPDGPGREPGGDDREGDNGHADGHRTDLGNARRLAALHGDDLRYCHPWGKWLVWAGDRWQVDETSEVHRRARDVVRHLHFEAAEQREEALRKVLLAFALNCEGEKRINAMVSLARQEPGIPILPADLDAVPWLLNCVNGTLDLRTGRLGPHVRGDFLTRRAAVAFDPGAACPAWEAFLGRIMADDAELIGFLRRAVGYSLMGVVTEHVLFFLYGRGRNGKSTLLGTIQHVLGDYAITINADVLTARGQDEHPTGVADLHGRRFVATIEVEDGRRMAESLVKTLTGGDRIRARRMRQDFYEFDPTHTLFLAANHKPTVRGTDEGIWRRIKLIPFRVQIPDAEVDRTLPARLRAEGPGILAWAVRGCLEWQAEGLREPEAVTLATAEYREESDVLADFLLERCLVSDGLRVRAGPLYRAYAEWCKDTGNHQSSMNKFGRLLTERGFAADKSNSVAWRLGLALKEPERAEGVPDF